MNSAIEVRHLTKQYPEFALKDVSFQIPEGSVVGFIGENGAGKSTTIKAILDLIKRDGGEITLLGEPDGAKDETLKEQIGVVFDENCFPGLSEPAGCEPDAEGHLQRVAGGTLWKTL